MKTTHLYRVRILLMIGAALIGAVIGSHAQTVTASITNSFDWMLTRDMNRRRLRVADSVESAALTWVSSCCGVVIGWSE